MHLIHSHSVYVVIILDVAVRELKREWRVIYAGKREENDKKKLEASCEGDVKWDKWKKIAYAFKELWETWDRQKRAIAHCYPEQPDDRLLNSVKDPILRSYTILYDTLYC